MCGKFTALASWSEVVAFSQPLTEQGGPRPCLMKGLLRAAGCPIAQRPENAQELSNGRAPCFAIPSHVELRFQPNDDGVDRPNPFGRCHCRSFASGRSADR
jgi:hypothetical protein